MNTDDIKLSLCEWLAEREENALRIALGKRGSDKDGWLEDAAYFRAAYSAINDTALMMRGMTLDPRIPRDTKEALLKRVGELES
jgi:hypothetical protein